MTAGQRIPIRFSSRVEALEPSAVAGVGEVARALAERLLLSTDQALAAWTGVASSRTLVVLGASDQLPWVDGVTYLGRDARAPRLLVPTTLEPHTVTPEMFEAAVVTHAPKLGFPLAVLVTPPRIVSLAQALPLRRERVRAWLETGR